jgi:hypothetical protein
MAAEVGYFFKLKISFNEGAAGEQRLRKSFALVP